LPITKNHLLKYNFAKTGNIKFKFLWDWTKIFDFYKDTVNN